MIGCDSEGFSVFKLDFNFFEPGCSQYINVAACSNGVKSPWRSTQLENHKDVTLLYSAR